MSSKKSHQQNQKKLQQIFTLQAQNTILDREKKLLYFKEEFRINKHHQNSLPKNKSASTSTTILILLIFATILNFGTCYFAGEIAQFFRDYSRYSVKETLIK
jgi:ABC-type multidrug transport system permease subunit